MPEAAVTKYWELALVVEERSSNGSKEHKITFGATHESADVFASVKLFADGLVKDLKTLYHPNIHFKRFTARNLNVDGGAVRGKSITYLLDDKGARAFANDDKEADESVVIKYARAGKSGTPGVMELRWIISANEYKAFVDAETVPAVLNALPAGAQNATKSLADAFTLDAALGAWTLQMPIKVDGAELKQAKVDLIKFMEIGRANPTANRTSGASKVTSGIKEQILELFKEVKVLQADDANTPAETQTIADIKVQMKALYDKCSPVQKIRMRLPKKVATFIG